MDGGNIYPFLFIFFFEDIFMMMEGISSQEEKGNFLVFKNGLTDNSVNYKHGEFFFLQRIRN